jgi:DNA/RNA endonuclease YhcR with UshA esterase domain
MKNWLLKLFAGLAVLGMVSAPVFAHHGTSAYDTTKLTTVKGTVTDFQFNNPHVMISVETKDDKGNVEVWTSEANSPNVLTRHGWNRDMIKKGDQITIIGNRPKNGAKTLRLQKVVLSNGQELDPNSLQD